ncbi:MAG: hypothetical protein ACRDTG_10765 [Pseudonocardiaceae bacterium]
MRVVCVHGVGQQQAGEQILLAEWLPALRDGLGRARMTARPAGQDVAMACYGNLFHPPGLPLAVARVRVTDLINADTQIAVTDSLSSVVADAADVRAYLTHSATGTTVAKALR